MDYKSNNVFTKLETARYELASTPEFVTPVWCEVKQMNPENVTSKVFMVMTLFTEPRARKRGFATIIMKQLIALADKEKATLVLKPASFTGAGPSDEVLESFYSKLGFTHFKDGLWERIPLTLTGDNS